ncbi:hypothetical protein HNR55_003064 [Acetobacter lovaniensis]|jgi:hypothetical protein|uniref:Uncharacterized protein n=1 Tax=Acetobacter lovaniensis TaxID=104100 RepID=A0A841QJG3_9PROT|nr:hypothetical protein [Acetobacter lovaniensis]
MVGVAWSDDCPRKNGHKRAEQNSRRKHTKTAKRACQNGTVRSNGGASLPALRAAFERTATVLTGSWVSKNTQG